MSNQLLFTGIRHEKMPENYIRPENIRPRLTEAKTLENAPIIDMGCDDKTKIIRQISEACSSYGFFQVINHGVSEELVKKMMQVTREFFHLPLEVKLKYYSDDPSKKMRLSTSFNFKYEDIHNWRDYLRLHCHPLEELVHEWPSEPSSFRDVVSSYCVEIRKLGFRMYEAISESLDLERDYIKNALGNQQQQMAINYYPTCPEPELTFGLPMHTDPNALTILLQDQEVAGLQIHKDGNWVTVNPYPNSFIVNIGDQLQALSNRRYKSVWHRAVVNSEKERISIATFLSPAYSSLVYPAEKLTNGESGAIYRSFTYEEYYNKFQSHLLMDVGQKQCLELFEKSVEL